MRIGWDRRPLTVGPTGVAVFSASTWAPAVSLDWPGVGPGVGVPKGSPGDSTVRLGLRSSGLDPFGTGDKTSDLGCGSNQTCTQKHARTHQVYTHSFSVCRHIHGYTLTAGTQKLCAQGHAHHTSTLTHPHSGTPMHTQTHPETLRKQDGTWPLPWLLFAQNTGKSHCRKEAPC